jgi:hypothetical protein
MSDTLRQILIAESLKQYKKDLAAFDWYFWMSDDSIEYRNGLDKELVLQWTAERMGDEFKQAYNEEHAKHFQNRDFVNYKKPYDI